MTLVSRLAISSGIGLLAVFAGMRFAGSSSAQGAGTTTGAAGESEFMEQLEAEKGTESVVLGGGCFWCIEAIFQNFRGVKKVESGYAGGTSDNPTYEEVSSGRRGHAEVVRVFFDPAVITLKQILTIFFHSHDPTTKDRQGYDTGPQYRSIILYGSAEQRRVTEEVVTEVGAAKLWGEAPLVTEVAPLTKFFRAEEYHQNYYRNNSKNRYCSIIIAPKVQKIRKEFSSLLLRPS